MADEDVLHRLSEHEHASQKRFEDLKHIIKENPMTHTPEVRNIFESSGAGGAGMGLGAGLGGGLLGGILGGALLGNNGVLGNRHGNWGGGDCVTPMQLQTATGSIVDSAQNNQIMSMLQGIATSVPVAEGQVQLALAQSTGQLSNQINTNLVSNTQGFANVNDNVNKNTANIIAVGESIKDTVNATSAQTQLGIANLATSGLQNTFALSQAINNDGDKTRALITSINDANLQRQLTVADLDRRDEANRNRIRETEINITNTNTATAQQVQSQAQMQNQFQILAQLAAGINNLASDIQAVRQTQSTVNFGTMTGNSQAAQATNNRVS